MKIAVIYNRESQKVINLFGMPNREKYGIKAIGRIVDALERGGHQVIALEGDKDLIDKLEEFMPRVLKGERPGMAFNLSYGIQGQARYTHVPGILEMIGIPYVGSGPLAHSLALDKVVAKMIFQQNGIPTPEFAVLQDPGFVDPDLLYPLIVKPKNEAVSMGIRIVNDQVELREAAGHIFEQFQQPVLVERYIEGREINVGLLGNGEVEAFSPAELVFGEGGPNIYTIDDKKGKSGREIQVRCPAEIPPGLAAEAQEIAKQAFAALGCFDCARVDMRVDENDKPYILEINSLPSLGEHGSYVAAAEAMGLDFPALVNRLVDVASARYFGTPHPPEVKSAGGRDNRTAIFNFLTERRDRIERQIESWVNVASRSEDPVGIGIAYERFASVMSEIGMRPVREFSDGRDVWTWETAAGLDDGTVLVVNLDVPVNPNFGTLNFRRDPEWLYGEGVGSSRAPLVMLEYALRALRHIRRLSKTKIGVVCYADEGRQCIESAEVIERVTSRASRVLVLSAGGANNECILARRGQRRYRLIAEGEPRRLGQRGSHALLTKTLFTKLEEASTLSSRKNRIAVAVGALSTEAFPELLPHRARVGLQMSYPERGAADAIDRTLRRIFRGDGVKWHLAEVSDRPPTHSRANSEAMFAELRQLAEAWEIPLGSESSLLPSASGLVPQSVPVISGFGPSAVDLFTSTEAVSRISLVQRTLLAAQYLAGERA